MKRYKLATNSQHIYYSGLALWTSYNGMINRCIQVIYGYATGIARIIEMVM